MTENSEQNNRHPTYEEALNSYRTWHRETHFFIHPTDGKKMGKGITPGEFFGFRAAYELLTGNKCPDYNRIG